MSSRPSFCAPLARLLGSCEPCRAFKWLCARDSPSPRTPSSASPRRRCSESTSARSSPPRTSPRCTQLSRRAAVAVVAARGLRAPLSADPPRSARSTRGTARAAAPHATPVESAGATERLLGPPGRVIIGPLDGAAEHGPRRPVDQDDDLRREAALRGTRRAPAGQASDTISHRSWATCRCVSGLNLASSTLNPDSLLNEASGNSARRRSILDWSRGRPTPAPQRHGRVAPHHPG